jgi:putative DNA primase/helicase
VQLSKAHVDSVLHEMSAKLAQPEFFAEAPAGINCASGFIAFDGYGKPNLLPHDPEHRCRHALPGRWRPGVTNPENPPPHSLLGQLLDGVFKGDADAVEKRKLLAEVAGAAAVGYGPKLRQPKAVVLAGETAENGKSQILDVIRGLLPSSAVASVSASKFGDERFIVGLRGKLLNATDELSEGAIASEAFKAAITGNPVSGRDVYRSAITFRPVAQHIFAVNRLPKFSGGMDRGVQRRLLPITFNRVIPANERVEDIGQRVGQEEPDLLLAFAVAGAERLIRQRGFTVPESSKAALQQWIYLSYRPAAYRRARKSAHPPEWQMELRSGHRVERRNSRIEGGDHLGVGAYLIVIPAGNRPDGLPFERSACVVDRQSKVATGPLDGAQRTKSPRISRSHSHGDV